MLQESSSKPYDYTESGILFDEGIETNSPQAFLEIFGG